MKKLKIILTIVAVLTVLGTGTYFFIFPNYSTGYRMGNITKFSEKGIIIKSGEGQLLMGKDGTPYTQTSIDDEGKVTKKVINPWYFSAEKEVIPKITKFAGSLVAVRYLQKRFNLFYDTDYRLQDIYPLSPPKKQSYTVKNPPTGAKSKGFRVGRIVKLSTKGTFIKTKEALVQLGDSGNQFKRMSISDDGLYQYATDCLKSGKKVRVYYTEQAFYQITLNDTKYDIWKVEILKNEN